MAQPNADSKKKWVYAFVPGKAEGSATWPSCWAGKETKSAEMASLALPVPPGFTITTEVCKAFFAGRPQAARGPEGRKVVQALEAIGNTVLAKFGDEKGRCSFRCEGARAPRCRA